MLKTFKIIFVGIWAILLFSCHSKTSSANSTKMYEDIITAIKNNELPSGKLVKYRIENFSDTSTIHQLPAGYFPKRGKAKGNICVLKTEKKLLIFIETEDLGHAGEYGVAYSENGEAPVWNDDEWGEFWTVDEKISNHWWKISFRLG